MIKRFYPIHCLFDENWDLHSLKSVKGESKDEIRLLMSGRNRPPFELQE